MDSYSLVTTSSNIPPKPKASHSHSNLPFFFICFPIHSIFLSFQPQTLSLFHGFLYPKLDFFLSSMAMNTCTLCLVSAMDRLWYHQIILWSDPLSSSHLPNFDQTLPFTKFPSCPSPSSPLPNETIIPSSFSSLSVSSVDDISLDSQVIHLIPLLTFNRVVCRTRQRRKE